MRLGRSAATSRPGESYVPPPALGLPPNLRETIAAPDGVAHRATDAKARRELGYAPRDPQTGPRGTAAAQTVAVASSL